MSNLTIQEVQALRTEMEDRLFQAIYTFEKETGFQVISINLEPLKYVTIDGGQVNCIQSLRTNIIRL